MTERPSQTRQILEKIDVLTDKVSGVENQLSAIKKQIEMQPQIDNGKFDAITESESVCRADVDRQIDEVRKEMKELRDSQTWAYRFIIGLAVTTFVGIVMQFVK